VLDGLDLDHDRLLKIRRLGLCRDMASCVTAKYHPRGFASKDWWWKTTVVLSCSYPTAWLVMRPGSVLKSLMPRWVNPTSLADLELSLAGRLQGTTDHLHRRILGRLPEELFVTGTCN
jgi:hypothetical protein